MNHNDPNRGRRLHAIARKIGMTDEDYRNALYVAFGVESSKDLNYDQARQFESQLRRMVERSRIEPHQESEIDAATGDGLADTLDPDGSVAPKIEHATPAQLKRIKFYAIPLAIHYIELDDLGHYREGDGAILTGDGLREWLWRRWNGVRRRGDPYRQSPAPVPTEILRKLYHFWINPRTNRMMIEGGFKRYCLNDNKFYYEQLSLKAAQYLIDRYREIYAIVEQQRQPSPDAIEAHH